MADSPTALRAYQVWAQIRRPIPKSRVSQITAVLVGGLQVLSVALLGFAIPGTEQTPYGPLMAASLFVILPVMVVFVFMQKRVIESIAVTGLKF